MYDPSVHGRVSSLPTVGNFPGFLAAHAAFMPRATLAEMYDLFGAPMFDHLYEPGPSTTPKLFTRKGVARPKLEFQAYALFCRFGSIDGLEAAFAAATLDGPPDDAALVAATAAAAGDLAAAAGAQAAEAAARDQGTAQSAAFYGAARAVWSTSLKTAAVYEARLRDVDSMCATSSSSPQVLRSTTGVTLARPHPELREAQRGRQHGQHVGRWRAVPGAP